MESNDKTIIENLTIDIENLNDYILKLERQNEVLKKACRKTLNELDGLLNGEVEPTGDNVADIISVVEDAINEEYEISITPSSNDDSHQ